VAYVMDTDHVVVLHRRSQQAYDNPTAQLRIHRRWKTRNRVPGTQPSPEGLHG